MKRVVAVSVFAVVSVAAASMALAQSGGMKGMDMKDMVEMKGEKSDKKVARGQVHKASGKVTKVDAAKGAVGIAHEPVSSMNWPAMTMTFIVKDKALLEKVRSGKKIDFEFVQQGRDYVVTAVK